MLIRDGFRRVLVPEQDVLHAVFATANRRSLVFFRASGRYPLAFPHGHLGDAALLGAGLTPRRWLLFVKVRNAERRGSSRQQVLDDLVEFLPASMRSLKYLNRLNFRLSVITSSVEDGVLKLGGDPIKEDTRGLSLTVN